MPSHTTFDVAMGKDVTDDLSLRLTVLNALNSRYVVDRSNSFGGTHYNFPRELALSGTVSTTDI